LGKRTELIASLADEIDRQLESVGARSRGMATRASILIASASIMTGLQIPEEDRPWQFAASLIAGAIAAIAGVLALLPRGGPEVSIELAEQTFWNLSRTQAQRNLTYWKLDTLKDQEKALKWRARLIVAGFAALAVALIFAALALLA
jgi:hypothetical protein